MNTLNWMDDRKRKGFLVSFTLVLVCCFLCCIFCDFGEEGQFSALASKAQSSFPSSAFDHDGGLDEVLVASSPSVLIRTILSKKNHEKSLRVGVPCVLSNPLFLGAVFTFLLVFSKYLRERHHIIIEYIHRKDGQKS